MTGARDGNNNTTANNSNNSNSNNNRDNNNEYERPRRIINFSAPVTGWYAGSSAALRWHTIKKQLVSERRACVSRYCNGGAGGANLIFRRDESIGKYNF